MKKFDHKQSKNYVLKKLSKVLNDIFNKVGYEDYLTIIQEGLKDPYSQIFNDDEEHIRQKLNRFRQNQSNQGDLDVVIMSTEEYKHQAKMFEQISEQ